MRWQRRGLLFRPHGEVSWSRSHAQLPTALPLEGDRFRVFHATRDARNRSSIGAVEVDLGEPARVLRVDDRPVLEPGPLGHFDDHGVYPASLCTVGDAVYLYYIGWNPGPRSPLFYSSIGLAVSRDGGQSFERYSKAPILARSEHDPCLVTSPCVLRSGSLWRMWYVSGFRWEERGESLVSYYHIKYAESDDGVAWTRRGEVAIDLEPGETNVARPCVLRRHGSYLMWYSCNRGAGYRIGFARSTDGRRWTRRDAATTFEGPEPGAWESDAQAYPWVVETSRGLAMLYNGNGFGRDGFGLAVTMDSAE